VDEKSFIVEEKHTNPVRDHNAEANGKLLERDKSASEFRWREFGVVPMAKSDNARRR